MTIRLRIPQRSLGFRLIAIALLPTLFAGVLVAQHLREGYAQVARVGLLEGLSQESLAGGRLQALLEVERGSVLGTSRANALPIGLAGLTELLGIGGMQRDLYQLLMDAIAAYQQRSEPNRELELLLQGRQDLFFPRDESNGPRGRLGLRPLFPDPGRSPKGVELNN